MFLCVMLQIFPPSLSHLLSNLVEDECGGGRERAWCWGGVFLPYQGFSIYMIKSVIFFMHLGVMSYLGRPSHSGLEIYESTSCK